MISLVIPTTSELSGIETAKEAMRQYAGFSEAVVVVDGNHEASQERLNGSLTVVRLNELCGSYVARNAGARAAKGDFIAFLDDGVRITIKDGFMPSSSKVVSGSVEFNRAPSNVYELWYQKNSFNNARFLKRFGFLPTIFLVVPANAFHKCGGFDEAFFSSGDVEFCQRISKYCSLEISDDVQIVTDLRTESQLFRKLRRQFYGHAYFYRRKYQKFSPIIVIARVVVNLFGVTGFSFPKKGEAWGAYLRANYHINIYKCKLLLDCIFDGESEIVRKMKNANSAEVKANSPK